MFRETFPTFGRFVSVLLFGCCLVIGFCEAIQNPYCALGCDFGTGNNYLHTVCNRDYIKCGPDESCGPDFQQVDLDDNLRQYVLDLHNELRNKVAAGNEFRGGHQPSAKKMLTLRYNKELEFIAQCWANTCKGNPLVHDTCRATSQHEHIGQNLGFFNSSNSNFNIRDSIKKLVLSWYDEVQIFKREWVNNTQNRGPGVKVGHYTQMLWADTDSLGCALTYYSTPNPNAAIEQKSEVIYHPVYGEILVLPPKLNKKWHHLLLVCNYGPGGNYLGAPIYDEGVPCSECPSDKPCSKYSALCGERHNVRKSPDPFVSIFDI